MEQKEHGCKCSVDTGIIGVADLNFYPDEQYVRDEYKKLGSVIEMKPGKYRVRLYSKDCWIGEVNKTSNINIPSGLMVIGDPCYGFEDHSQWIDIFHKYQYFKINDEKIMTCDTGGDGEFKVLVTWDLIE